MKQLTGAPRSSKEARRLGAMYAQPFGGRRQRRRATANRVIVHAWESDTGRVVGLASAVVEPSKQAQIYVWVDEHYRRHGLGSVLLGKLTQRLMLVGVVQVHALVDASNTAALMLLGQLPNAELTIHGPQVCAVAELASAGPPPMDRFGVTAATASSRVTRTAPARPRSGEAAPAA
jgi:GNAT superfamily N-acetyltransferase